MKFNRIAYSIFFILTLSFVSCDKGYTVRFTNYSQEGMDSVIVGNDALVFTNIEVQAVTEYVPIKQGTYQIQCITKDKSKYYSSLTIPKSGTGARSIQIDGTNTVVVLEQ